ncbi:MAG: NAD(P)/FAD-dependent oxidoreductase [Gammaproteobacteria bacterium]|nr:NAD(P)/FAD-dependent oxidoreductase [Gammaproteobacteria bacterium]
MTDYDVIVVGAGHNGLVCAAYLARAGRKVLVVEANQQPGGGAATREFADGFSVSACAHWLTHLNPEVKRDLALEHHGLTLAARDLDSIGLDPGGQHVTVKGDSVDGPSISTGDKAAYQEFHRMTLKFSSLLANAFKLRPPKLVAGNFSDRLNLARLGLGMKLMGKQDMSELLRLALINIYDVMEERFDNELLKATLSFDGVLGAHMGPRSPNTVFGYLYRRVGDVYGFNGPAVVRGGMGGVGAALVEAANSHQVVCRTGVAVQDIMLKADRARGVRLVGGEEITAKLVVSNADPKTTFNKLVGLPNVETGLARRVKNIRMQGGAAKLHLALDGLPEFKGLSAQQLGQRLVIAPTMNYIEEAFNPAKYGEYSTAPAMDISIPSLHDASLAPAGKHVLSAIVQFAPYALRAGWESEKDKFKSLVIARIAEYAPGLEQLVTASELLTPVDLEQEFHMYGGHWHHGEISLDQIMFMRPFPGATQYGTAVDGLYLCGAGTHPGGGVMGLSGRNAAREIIKRGNLA